MAARGGRLFTVYAAMAVVGFVLPFVFLVPWLQRPDDSLALFLTLPFASEPAALFSADVLWSATVFLVFAIAEGRRVGVQPIWLAPLMICLVGLCFALPLFLALRERALAR